MATLPDIVNYRANLQTSEFPFLSELQGRSVILPGIDQEQSLGQAYYMHNVLPTQKGYTSVGYLNLAVAPADSDGTFAQKLKIRDASDNSAYLGRTSSGRNYIFLSTGIGWIRTTDVAIPAGEIVTSAYVNGVTYICFGSTNVYKYDFATNTLVLVVLTGLAANQVKGIAAASGYMVAWKAQQVGWSSLIDPTDFVPSLVTGAGGGNIQNTKASIVLCAPQNTGFIIYTKENAVCALSTGNTSFPFTFKDVQGAGGIPSASMVSFDGNSASHVIYSTAGLQQITTNVSLVIHPQLTDFIAGSQFEDYDESSKEFITLPLNGPMKKKITIVANRYLVFSYGIAALTHALVFDISLNRWGKLKFTHVDCFELVLPSSDVIDTPKRSIGFLTADGNIFTSVSSYDTAGSNGVILLGKYQLDRNRMSSLQELTVESIRQGQILNVTMIKTMDGITKETYTPYLAKSVTTFRQYNANEAGLNHSVLFQGAFHLTSLQFKFVDEGEA